MRTPNVKHLIKRILTEVELIERWNEITSRYGENNTAEIRQYLPADPYFLYDYKCLVLTNEEGLSKEEAIARADEMTPNDWYEVWLEVKSMIDHAKEYNSELEETDAE